MKRQGKFTGKIYDENYNFSQCTECCTILSDEQANNEEYLNQKHIKDLLTCITCMGCPTSQGRG